MTFSFKIRKQVKNTTLLSKQTNRTNYKHKAQILGNPSFNQLFIQQQSISGRNP